VCQLPGCWTIGGPAIFAPTIERKRVPVLVVGIARICYIKLALAVQGAVRLAEFDEGRASVRHIEDHGEVVNLLVIAIQGVGLTDATPRVGRLVYPTAGLGPAPLGNPPTLNQRLTRFLLYLSPRILSLWLIAVYGQSGPTPSRGSWILPAMSVRMRQSIYTHPGLCDACQLPW